jgi:hypothetical protein
MHDFLVFPNRAGINQPTLPESPRGRSARRMGGGNRETGGDRRRGRGGGGFVLVWWWWGAAFIRGVGSVT